MWTPPFTQGQAVLQSACTVHSPASPMCSFSTFLLTLGDGELFNVFTFFLLVMMDLNNVDLIKMY